MAADVIGRKTMSEDQENVGGRVTRARVLEDEVPILESTRVSVKPSTVGAQSADLSFIFMSPVRVFAGGEVIV